MYRYEYERISAELSGWGIGAGNQYAMEGYQQIIQQRAADGWRYVGYLPAVQRGTGHVEEIDLIFEKEVSA